MIDTIYDNFCEVFGTYEPIQVDTVDGIVLAPDFGFILCVIFSIVLLYGVLMIIRGIVSSIFR